MSDVIVVMRDGLIQQMGGPTELYERPVNRFVADFIGTSNPIPGTVEAIESDGRVVVRSGRGLVLRGQVTDPSATLAVGDTATIAVRPERLEIHPAEAGATTDAGWASATGRINQGTYLGDQTEYRVHTDQAGELIVRRQNATGAGASQGMGPGDAVVVRWREEANLVLVG